MLNEKLFRARIVAEGMSTEDVAKVIGCNVGTLYRKLNGTSDFTRNEIQLFKAAFHLSAEEVEQIFFA
jgi:transposase